MKPRTPEAGGTAPPRLLRAYRRSRRLQQRGLQAAAGLLDGLWLGVLDADALHRLDATYYDARAHYVDDEYNTRGLLDWERDLVDRHLRPGSRVVVTGAGGGREVVALLDLGFDAVGFEPHPGLAAAGSDLLARRGHPGRLSPAARDVFPPEAGPCDGVVVGWGSYMLIPGRERRIAFLRGARAALPGGAPLLVSFFTRPGSSAYFRWVARTAGAVRRLRGSEPVELGDALVPNYAHHFVEADLAEELAAAGFELLEYRTEPYGHAAARARPGA